MPKSTASTQKCGPVSILLWSNVRRWWWVCLLYGFYSLQTGCHTESLRWNSYRSATSDLTLNLHENKLQGAHGMNGSCSDEVSKCKDLCKTDIICTELSHFLYIQSPCLILRNVSESLSTDKLFLACERMRPTAKDDVFPLTSSAPPTAWQHSVFSMIPFKFSSVLHRSQRELLPSHKNVRSLAQISVFGLTFQKCAQVSMQTNVPSLTFMLIINNTGIPSAATLSQLSIRDSVSGLTLQSSSGILLESGFQTFTKDILAAGSSYIVKYSASIDVNVANDQIWELPAFLTFSNASQNDINLFGPLEANFTMYMNSTSEVSPNHGLHFVGFIVAFVVSFVMVCIAFLISYCFKEKNRKSRSIKKKKRKIVNNEVDPEYAVYNINETSKEEAAFEDKIIDIFLYEDPQNMYDALENLDMSSLLHISTKLESYRVLIYKDLIAKLLRNLKVTSEFSPAAEKRLKSVLNGQLMGMEGKLKEEHVARMAALAAEFNLETREEMEREHRKVAKEKEKAEQLFKHMNQQMALECNVLLDTLHKLDQRHLQHSLLVRHEEASAKVQRQIMVFRRVELHKIFFEEVEEMTKMGELEKNVAKKLLHVYLSRQEQLEELLDILLANQRSILGERHAHRQFLVHSLQSLRNLVYDVFTKATAQVESVFEDLNNEGFLPEDVGESLFGKTTNNLLQVKQKFEEALSREKKTLHCNLIKKRRSQIYEKLQEQYQKRQELSVIHKTSAECQDLVNYLNCWQKLLLLQYVELGDLINNLDEEAAADIRKVIMRLLQSAITEIKGIQPKISQELLSLGLPRHAVQNIGWKHELITGALPEAQEKLHKEGKIAVKVLQKTRETLQNQLDVEVKEQQDLRMREKSIFKSLCKAQLTLSEDDLLKMKLEFQNCFSQVDKCLVLPKAQARSRLKGYLSEWRREMLRNMEHSQSEIHGKQLKIKKHPAETNHSEEYFDFKTLKRMTEKKIHLYEEEKQVKDMVIEKVLVEILYERANYLKAQEEGLAVHITAFQLQKAEKRVRTLETYVAILNLQSLLVEELRISGSMTGPTLAEMIHKHIQGLEEADRLVHLKEQAWWNAWKKDQSMAASREEDFPTNYNSHEESQIASILEQAFTKRQQIMDIEKRRLMNEHTSSQTTEDFKEQLEFKRLQAYFDQDLALIADFVKQAQIPANILLEVLRLLLPTSLENDLISILDAICSRPTQATQFNGIEKGKLETSRKPMHIKLKEEITKKYAKPGNLGKDKGSILKKKQGQLLKQVSFPHLENPYNLKEHSISENHITAVESATETLNVSDTKEVFIFRPKLEQEESMQKSVKKKKKKRNFLNLKKAAVASMDIP
ncbi:limbin-like [Erpetoichthys calabaricus]|uniref:limbin-like n=1 Tax=Erpetoichthys calabaricus TaxID=27687 RepID=UPI0022347A34|nr:limbin-like [Erpetoichthys calabaricus]